MLETRGLGMHIGGVRALDGVDFSLGRGDLHCLIGPNGAGKSTFFKCVSGQLRPSFGEALIDGHPVVGRHPHEIARLGVGVKTQVPSVMDGLSARENVWLSARSRYSAAAADQAARAMLDRFGLAGLAARKVGTLAHGERQRVELASVLAPEPRLLLLDEPAAGLGSSEMDDLAELITGLRGERSIIVVEHDMHFIRAIADKVTVFHQGRILVQGRCADVLADERVRSVYLGRAQ